MANEILLPYSIVQYIGQIQQFPFNFTPYGWIECDGQLLSTDEYSYLHSIIGNSFGGSGTSSFAVPDLRPKDGNGNVINLTIGQIYDGKPYIKSFIAAEGVYPGTQSMY